MSVPSLLVSAKTGVGEVMLKEVETAAIMPHKKIIFLKKFLIYLHDSIKVYKIPIK